jgi:3-hydroxybutyryl-CoA dehydrogenase
MLRVAIIGAGTAGRSFAAACAAAGFPVILEDVMPSKLRRAEQELAGLAQSVALVSTVEDAVHDAAIVIDFVPDELESKLEIWALIDRMAPPHTILCTPSETLSITDLASCTYRPAHCVMVRGALTPPGTLRLLHAAQTSLETLTTAQTLFSTLSFTVSIQPDPDLPMLLKNMRATTIS